METIEFGTGFLPIVGGVVITAEAVIEFGTLAEAEAAAAENGGTAHAIVDFSLAS